MSCKEEVKAEEIRAYEKLNRFEELYPEFNSVNKILSHYPIISGGEDKFIQNFSDDLDGGSREAREIYRTAADISEKAALIWANIKDVIAPYYSQVIFNNLPDNFLNKLRSIPAYDRLFGSLDYINCDHCRSIFGPAAYFVDLMSFVQTYITDANPIPEDCTLDYRRPDLAKIRLDCSNSTDIIPSIDLVNELLEAFLETTHFKETKIQVDAYELAKDAIFPQSLPFNSPHKEIQGYLNGYETSLWQIYQAFNRPFIDDPFENKLDGHMAREFLQLSPEDSGLIKSEISSQDISGYFGGVDLTGIDGLENVDVLLEQMKLTREELNELIYQNLDRHEVNAGLSRLFFINSADDGLGALAISNQEGTGYDKLLNLSPAKLDRMYRFLKLSRKLNWSFADLDWSIRSLYRPYLPERVLKFDGIDDYISCRNASKLDLLSLPEFTIEAWISPESSANNAALGLLISRDDVQHLLYLGLNPDGKLEFYIFRMPGDNGQETRKIIFEMESYYDSIANGIFTQVAVTYANEKFCLFINGKKVLIDENDESEKPFIRPALSSPISCIEMGLGRDLFDKYFHGCIKEVRIWNKAHDEAALQENIYQRFTGKERDLIGYWPLAEGLWDYLPDMTSGGSNGVLGGGEFSAQPEWVYRELILDPLSVAEGASLLRFNGIDQYLAAEGFELAETDQITIEAEIEIEERLGAARQDDCILCLGENGQNAEIVLYSSAQGNLVFQFGSAPIVVKSKDSSPPTLPLGQKIHVCVAFKTTDTVNNNGEVKIYINGKETETDPIDIPSATFKIEHGLLNVGRNFSGEASEYYFIGMIRELRLWSSERTNEQINSYLYRKVPSSSPGLAGYWRLDDVEGGKARDISGNENDLYLGGILGDYSPLLSPTEILPRRGDLPVPASGTVLQFDGDNDVIVIKNPENRGLGRYERITIELWFNVASPIDTGRKQVLFSQGDAEAGLCIYLYDGLLHILEWNNTLENAAQNIPPQIKSLFKIPFTDNGKWHHIAITQNEFSHAIPDEAVLPLDNCFYRKDDFELRAYLDAVPILNESGNEVATGYRLCPVGPIYLGGLGKQGKTCFDDAYSDLDNTYFFAGQIANLGVWRIVKSADEIDYGRYFAPPITEDLITYLPMNEGEGWYVQGWEEENRHIGTLQDRNIGLVCSRSDPELINIYSHYFSGQDSLSWKNYCFSGRMQIKEKNASIGIAFYSLHIEGIDVAGSDVLGIDQCYILGRDADQKFQLFAHPSGVQKVKSSNSSVDMRMTDINPEFNVWYNFLVVVESTATQINIKAKIWPESEAMPVAFQIDAYDDSSIRINSGTVGLWTTGSVSSLRQFDNLRVWPSNKINPLPADLILDLNFEAESQMPEPSHWLDGEDRQKLALPGGLFKQINVEGGAPGETAFGTNSEDLNIHSYFSSPDKGELLWNNYLYSGRMRISHADGCIGVVFFSRQAEGIDQYYRLSRDAQHPTFSITAHPRDVQKVKSFDPSIDKRDSGISPLPNIWYNYLIEVSDTGTATRIRGKIWPESGTAPVAYSIDAIDDSDIRIKSGGAGVWASAAGSKYFGQLKVQLNSIYNENFESYSAGQDPANWRDTNLNNFEDNSLFKTYTLGGKTVFGTKYMPPQQWAQLPIHTHYIGSGARDWKNYTFAGCFRIGDPSDMMFGGIGVTVLSQYFPGSQSTRYYKLTAIPNQSFIMLLNESNAALKGIYTANLNPQVNTWYRFIIEVEDTGSRTNIKAKVWPESQTEPSTYQINAYDDVSTRLKSGTVGFLTTGYGSKYFKDLGVFSRQHSLDSSIPERWHDLTMRTSKKGAEVDDLFKTVDLLDNTPHWISLPSDTYNYNYPVLLHPLSRASLEFDGKREYLAANGYRGFTPGQLALEAWVRPSEIKKSSIIRMSGKDSEERDVVIAFGMDGSGKLELSQKQGGVVTLLASSQDIVLDTSKFYHVALSTTDGGLVFFVDGNVVASDFQTLGLLNSSGLDIKRVDIGRGMDDCHLSGKIKEVRIWNTSRSQDEIRLSMYQKAYPSDDLLGYWSLGEEEGLLDIDHSARQNYMRKGGLDEDRCPVLTEIKVLGFWRPSRKALSFNGTSHLIKYEYDRPSEVVSRCTIEVWFLVEDKNISQQKQVIYQEGDDQCGLSIYVCDGSLYLGGYNLLCGWEGTWLYSDRIESGRWHHAALVLDGRGEVRDEALQGYLDGKLMVCGSASQISGKKVSFALGGLRSPIRFHDDPDHSYGGSSGQLFCGQILSLRIWNSARTPEQIRDNLYLEPVGTNNSLPGLDLWWESDVVDPLGCTITDQSGNDRNGTYAEQQLQTMRLPAKYELPSLSINEEALEGIAVIKLLMERSSLAIDRLTALWYVLKHSGYDNSTPLFDKIFNPKGTVMPPWDYYLDEPMRWDKSGRGSSDSRIRSRLMGAMHLSDSDLNLIVEYLSGEDELIIEIDNNYLTQMYQLSQLAKLLSLSVVDLLDLLPMEGGRPDSLLDILRISNTAEWLNTSGLSVADLVCFARPISDPKSANILLYTEEDIRSQADTIFRQFASFAINAKTFQSDHISEALSGDIFDFLNPGIVTDFGAVAQAYSIETDLSQMPPELAETEDWMTEFEVLKAEFDRIRTGLGDEIFGRHEIKAENGTITQTKITGRLDSHGFITEWGLVLEMGDYSPESLLAIFDGQTPAKAVQDLLPKVTEKLMERNVIQNMLISPDGPVRTALESSLEGIDNILESELANLFDVKKEMISSILGSLGDEGVDGLLAELNALLPTEEQPKPVISEELSKKFFKMSKLVYLAGSFELTAEETALLIAHPEYYSVSDLLAPTILDLYNLYCYKQLQEAFGDMEGLLDAVLALPVGDKAAINEALFELTGWVPQQIAELVDCLKASSYNTIPGLWRLKECFDIAASLKTAIHLPMQLSDTKVLESEEEYDFYIQRAAELLEVLRSAHTEEEWPDIIKPIHDELAVLRRDALLALALVKLPKYWDEYAFCWDDVILEPLDTDTKAIKEKKKETKEAAIDQLKIFLGRTLKMDFVEDATVTYAGGTDVGGEIQVGPDDGEHVTIAITKVATANEDGAALLIDSDGFTPDLIVKMDDLGKINIYRQTRFSRGEDAYHEYFLMDMQVGAEMDTSRIVQATSALQYYVQRCLMNLEPGADPSSIPTAEWEWVKNYRVWEANRKVFLYPENYIEPDLRDTKTPFFEELEQELMQSDITKESVEAAYTHYLEKFVEVANLKIVGSYLHVDLNDEGEALLPEVLYVVGKTRIEPGTFYLRKRIKDASGERWLAWEKIDLVINSDFVTPAYAFGKLFLFWMEFKKLKKSVLDDDPATTDVKEYKMIDVYMPEPKYSFFNFSQEWKQPQTLVDLSVTEPPTELTEEEHMQARWQRMYAQRKLDLSLPDLSQGGEEENAKVLAISDQTFIEKVIKEFDMGTLTWEFWVRFANNRPEGWIHTFDEGDCEKTATLFDYRRFDESQEYEHSQGYFQADAKNNVEEVPGWTKNKDDLDFINASTTAALNLINMGLYSQGAVYEEETRDKAAKPECEFEDHELVADAAKEARDAAINAQTVVDADSARSDATIALNAYKGLIEDPISTPGPRQAAWDAFLGFNDQANQKEVAVCQIDVNEGAPLCATDATGRGEANAALDTYIGLLNDPASTPEQIQAAWDDFWLKYNVAPSAATLRSDAELDARNKALAANGEAQTALTTQLAKPKWQSECIIISFKVCNQDPNPPLSFELDLGVWNHIAIVQQVTGTTHAFKIYRNGVPILARQLTGLTLLPEAETLIIGRQDADVLYAFQAQMSEFRIWSGERSMEEIANNMDKRMPSLYGNLFCLPLNKLEPGCTMLLVPSELDFTYAQMNEVLNRIAGRERLIIFFGDQITSLRNNLKDKSFKLVLVPNWKQAVMDLNLSYDASVSGSSKALLHMVESQGLSINDFATSNKKLMTLPTNYVDQDKILLRNLEGLECSFFDVNNQPGWYIVSSGDEELLVRAIFSSQEKRPPIQTTAEVMKVEYDPDIPSGDIEPQKLIVAFELDPDNPLLADLIFSRDIEVPGVEAVALSAAGSKAVCAKNTYWAQAIIVNVDLPTNAMSLVFLDKQDWTYVGWTVSEAMALTRSGKIAATYEVPPYWYFGNRRLALWDCETGMQKDHVDLNGSDWKLAPLLAISDDASVVVSATEYDHKLVVWHVGGNHAKIPANQSLGHKGRVCGLAITPNGSKAVSISRDGELKLWNLGGAGSLEKTLSGHVCSGSDAIAISDDGKWAVSVHSGLNLAIWDLKNGTGPVVIADNTQDELHTGSITSLCIFETSEGRRVLTGSEDKTVKLWNAGSVLNANIGRLIRTFAGHTQRVTAVSVREDMAISSSDDRTIKVWRLSEEEPGSETVEFAFERLTSYAVYQLSENLFTGGIDGLLSLASQKASELNFWETYQPNEEPNVVLVPKSLEINDAPFENPIKNTIDFKGTYRLYYEEVFFHIPFLIANKLNSNQAFEEAQKWYHYIFNPTANDAADGSGKDRYWRYLPFKKDSFESLKTLLTDGPALAAYREDPFDPHAIAALRMAAYKKAVVMKYIDNLLDWGDALFMQDSRESINEATGLYALGYDLLGPRPRSKTIKRFQEIGTYEEFIQDYEKDSEFLTEVEKMASSSAGPAAASPHRNIITDFCVPENAKFIGYWDLVEDRLLKIRHSQNIEGVYRQLALFSPPLEPMDLVRAVASGLGIVGALAELNVAVPHYRYPIVVGMAKEMAANAISLGSALLDAIEKRDAEKLASIQNTQELAILEFTANTKQRNLDEATKSAAALEESKARTVEKKDYYQRLWDENWNGYEIAACVLKSANMAAFATNVAFRLVKMGFAIGEAKVAAGFVGPLPEGETRKSVITPEVAEAIAEAAEKTSDMVKEIADLIETSGERVRRRDEWDHEKKEAESEIREIDIQLEIAQMGIQQALDEIELHEKTIQQNKEIAYFYRSKFSNEALYNWMIARLSALYFQSYKTAYDMAKSAEKCLQFEIPSTQTYITPTHWDSLRKGLLAGESLLLQIDQMEKSHLAQDSRFIEIQKTISMRNSFNGKFLPSLLMLLDKGACEFKLKEEIFDKDYPGHYFRVIKTIELEIVTQMELEPYHSVNVTLIQLGNKTLLTPNIDGVRYLMDPSGSDQQDSVRVNWRSSQQVAISTVNDPEASGMFYMDFIFDNRYFPFEGTGLVSSWRLEIPHASNPDLVSNNLLNIDDVLIHIRYTAKSDRGRFKTEVEKEVKKLQS